ncbi:MAG: zinc-ribbon domain-containing protein [Planctomycetota bacterium]
MHKYSDQHTDDDPDDGPYDGFEHDQSTTDTCPHCGAEIYDDAVQCPACGNYITADAGVTSAFAGRPWWWIVLGVLGVLTTIYLLMMP